MPLTAEQKQAIETLKSVAAEDAEEFRNELQTQNSAVAHHIYRRGFTEAEGRYKPRAEAAEAKITEAEAAKAEAERKLREAEGKQPDVEKIHKDWQTKLDAAKAETEAERTARKAEREARKLSDLRAHMTGLDPEYARWKAGEHAGRLRTKDDGTVELLEPGSEVPVQIPAGKTPYEVLAEEIIRTAPAALRTSNADSGGGTGGGGGGGGNVFDRIREQTKTRQEGATEAIPLEKRLGMTG